MKLIKQIILLIITITLSVGIVSTTYAGGGQASKRQKQQEARDAKDAKDNAVKQYKTTVKPEFDKNIANKKVAIANKKSEIKAKKEVYQKQYKETEQLYKAKKVSENKLKNLQDKIDKATFELELFIGNDKERFQKRDDLIKLKKQYDNEKVTHENGIDKNFSDSHKKFVNAKQQLKQRINELESLRVDESLLVANKFALKDKAKNTKKVVGAQIPNIDQYLNNPQNPQNIRNPNRVRVFDQQLVNDFDVNKLPANDYQLGVGQVRNSKGEAKGFGLLPSDAAGGLGKFIGGGANSMVYESKSDSSKVNKLVRLTDNNGNLDPVSVQAIKDQAGGRAILKRLKTDYAGEGMSKLFSVADATGDPVIWTAKEGNVTHKFALSKEDNISTEELDGNGKVLGVASNAQERLELRQKADSSVTGLTPREELTINLVIRALNQNGITWTDHKLANLDIVKDPNSPTGHRVVFFDFDAFRPVVGATRLDRYAEARDLQRAFDQREDRSTVVNTSGKFDFTAFGEPLPTLTTAGANRDRLLYKNIDNRGSAEVNDLIKNQLPSTKYYGDNLDVGAGN